MEESYLEEEIPVFRLLVYRSTLKMVAVGFFETSVSLTIKIKVKCALVQALEALYMPYDP